MSEDNKKTIASMVWAKCLLCESDHLIGCDATGKPVVQFGSLEKDKEMGGYIFFYESQPTLDRADELVDLELHCSDEQAIKLQAQLLVVNGMAAMCPIEEGQMEMEPDNDDEPRPVVH